MTDMKIEIPVELKPELSGARGKFQQFADRVRQDMEGRGGGQSSGMESLFFSPTGGKDLVKGFGDALKGAEQKFSQFTSRMAQKAKSTVSGASGAALAPLLNFAEGYKRRGAGQAISSPFARMEKAGYHARMAAQRASNFVAPIARGIYEKSRGVYDSVAKSRFGQFAGRAYGALKEDLGDTWGEAKRLGKGALSVGKVGKVELKGFAKYLAESTKSLRAFAVSAQNGGKALGGMIGRGLGRLGGGMGKLGGFAMRAGAGLAMGGVGLVTGALTSAYSEGIQAYEGTANARLQAAQTLGSNAKFMGGKKAASYGFRLSEMAQIQAQAASQGFRTESGGDLERLAQIQRSLGAQGVQVAGGMMRRGGGNAESVFRKLSGIVAIGMATGLEKARIPEFLQASNDYAERQIAISPDGKDSAQRFATALARLQEQGGKGFSGKYGADLLNKMDAAIKGATGANQSFVLRAFGFGRGTSYYDSLKAQQQGALGQDAQGRYNITKVMENFQREGYTGKMGNVAMSQFFGLSLEAVEKLKAINLEKTLDAKGKEDKIKGILREESGSKMPLLQKEAFDSMVNFGKVAETLSQRFNQMAEKGGSFYAIKEAVTKMQETLMSVLTPVLQLIAAYLPKIAGYFEGAIKGFAAFGEAFGKSKGTISGIGAGFSAFGSTFSQVSGLNDVKEAALKDPELMKKLISAQKRREMFKDDKTNDARIQFEGRTVRLDAETVDLLIMRWNAQERLKPKVADSPHIATSKRAVRPNNVKIVEQK